jgi:hypothetical protein
MITRKILMLPNVEQQAAPGNVSTRGLPGRCPIVPEQTETLQAVAASGNVRGNRLPTHAESGKPSAPITRIQLRTVKSGLPDVASRSFRRRGEVWLPSRRRPREAISSSLPNFLYPAD